MDNRKRLIIKITAAITGLLLFLTFFSNTIYSLNIAGVTVGFTHTGVVTTTHRLPGVLEFPETTAVYAEYSGRIFLAVEENDRVIEGDLLFQIHSDVDFILERLEADNTRLDRALLNLNRIQADIAAAQANLAALVPIPFIPREVIAPDFTALDQAYARLALDIERAEEDYQTQLALFAAGVIPRAQVDTAQQRLAALQNEVELNAQSRAAILYNHQRNVERAGEENLFALENQMRLYQNERNSLNQRIMDLQHSLAAAALEEAEARRLIARHREQLDADGITREYAWRDSIVESIISPDNPFIDRGRPVLRLAYDNGGSFSTTVPFPVGLTALPDEITTRRVFVDIPFHNEFRLAAEIERLTAVQGRLYADVYFTSDLLLYGGERVEVVIEELSSPPRPGPGELPSEMLPNHAIRQDMGGYFILYVERVENTLLGYSHYAARANINVLLAGDRYTSFRRMNLENADYPIILQSDRPVSEGDRVRMVAGR